MCVVVYVQLFYRRIIQSAGTAIADIASSPNSKLNKVTQLTGFSDPVYAEAYVHVNQYDIVLDVLIVNQTSDTLQNCTLELATLGDLKLVERPHPVVLAPHDFCNIKANVKVSSTENGIIFGNIGECSELVRKAGDGWLVNKLWNAYISKRKYSLRGHTYENNILFLKDGIFLVSDYSAILS